MKIINLLAAITILGQVCHSSEALDGADWLDFDTDYTTPTADGITYDTQIEYRELVPSRFYYAIEALKDVKRKAIEENEYYGFGLKESDIPEGTQPHLVRAVFKYSAGSQFEVLLDGDTLRTRHRCIMTLEEGVYKSPLIAFLPKAPKDVLVYNHVMGW